jgi:hypothetical protein
MTWTKERALSILISESKSIAQAEYNVGRAQLGVIGYSKEEYHKEFCSKYSESELEEFSREYEKAHADVMTEYEKAKRT